MSGRHKWKTLSDQVRARPGAQERLERLRLETEMVLTLADLRQAREMTQTQLAAALEMTQPGISRIERQSDLYLSTLRSYVRALGGELRLIAEFPDWSVSLESFGELEPSEPQEAKAPLQVDPVADAIKASSPSSSRGRRRRAPGVPADEGATVAVKGETTSSRSRKQTSKT